MGFNKGWLDNDGLWFLDIFRKQLKLNCTEYSSVMRGLIWHSSIKKIFKVLSYIITSPYIYVILYHFLLKAKVSASSITAKLIYLLIYSIARANAHQKGAWTRGLNWTPLTHSLPVPTTAIETEFLPCLRVFLWKIEPNYVRSPRVLPLTNDNLECSSTAIGWAKTQKKYQQEGRFSAT